MPAVKKVFSVFLRVAISAILIVFLFKQIDIDISSLLRIIRGANPLLLGLAFLVFLVLYVVALFRWDMLLKGAKVDLPLRRVIVSYCGGVFFNLFMPSSIGGDVMRSIDLASYTKKPKEIVATVMLDRLSGYVALVMVALAAMSVGFSLVEDRWVLGALALIVGLLVVIMLVLFNQPIYRWINARQRAGKQGSAFWRIFDSLRNLHHEIHIFRGKRRIVAGNLALSLVIQLAVPLVYYCTALALGSPVRPLYFFIYIPIISAISMLPISIGGLGVRDATTVFLFAKAGMSKDFAFAMSLMNFAFLVACAIIGGCVYVLTVHNRRIQRSAPPRV